MEVGEGVRESEILRESEWNFVCVGERGGMG